MFITTLKNVKNNYTDEVGDMKFISYKYDKESRLNRQGSEDHRGLVVFHKGKYIKSFILTFEQVKLCIYHDLFLLDDIGFILNAHYMDMTILDLGSHAVNNLNRVKDGYLIDFVEIHDFVIERDNKVMERMKLDYKETGIAGFRKAIKIALLNPNEDSFLVPHTLPEKEEIEFNNIINYSKDI